MTEKECRGALDWLAQNTDKWKNWNGKYEFFVPMDQVPQTVVDCLKEKKKVSNTLTTSVTHLNS